MKSIETYEKIETKKLQSLLLRCENNYKNNNLKLLNDKLDDSEYLKIIKVINDQDIDIHLIRMELNKRLWISN